MKQIIIVIGMAVLILLTSMSILSVDHRAKRQEELNRAVSAAVKQTVKVSQVEGQNEISNNNEMVGEFLQLLSVGLENDGNITVEVMGADYKEGLFDVKVTETFQYLNGKIGKVSVRKCAIYDSVDNFVLTSPEESHSSVPSS
ncbi:MAG: hypothetical protein K6G85_05495 [Eubacterium sp.]|nr:hypothetical protein [Eubacterium sp.]